MKSVFSLDGRLMSVLGRITDFFILNIIFIITCIPIVTIGPALTALYSVTLKMVKNEDSYIFKGYFTAFKENFKISLFAWLIMLVVLILFGVDYRIMTVNGNDLGKIFPVIFLTLIFVGLIISIYLFPYIARFENNLRASFKNAILIALASLPWTILLVIITCGILFVLVFLVPLPYDILIWFVCGFALLAYIQSFIFRKVFAKYEPKEEDEKGDKE